MEETLHSGEVYDFRKYDRIWERVAPNLAPYPDMAAQTRSAQPAPAAQVQPQAQAAALTPQPRQEDQLPGADPNPCCMGTAALELVDVLAGYVESELSDQRYMLALARQAPSWARQRLKEIAADQADHAKQLMAAYYLITGECYQPSVNNERIYVGRWCPALRERYHASACNGLNYARTADDTSDPCLRKLLAGLSADSYRNAEVLMGVLERSVVPFS